MKPILEIRNLWKIYGNGCKSCFDLHTSESNICKRCGSIIALKDISFQVYRGEAIGIVGESGSGKTTLLKIMNFDIPPTCGEYKINLNDKEGGDFTNLDFLYQDNPNIFNLSSFQKKKIRNFLIGMVYQDPYFGLRMNVTVGGNIGEKLIMTGLKNIAKIRERATTLLEKTEISRDRIDDYPKNFSGGMQQRVQIAKALSVKPVFLFLDEPTNGLDLSVQARVLDLIRNLKKEMNFTMVVVSHDLGIIRHLTKRTIVMKNGVIVEAGLTDQILEDPQEEFTQVLVNSAL